jgi:hypothetical protein
MATRQKTCSDTSHTAQFQVREVKAMLAQIVNILCDVSCSQIWLLVSFQTRDKCSTPSTAWHTLASEQPVRYWPPIFSWRGMLSDINRWCKD